jgi:hypothetical protein
MKKTIYLELFFWFLCHINSAQIISKEAILNNLIAFTLDLYALKKAFYVSKGLVLKQFHYSLRFVLLVADFKELIDQLVNAIALLSLDFFLSTVDLFA